MSDLVAKNATRPFQFTQLPPELQKLVLEKYYEDEWSVEIVWTQGYPSYKWISSPIIEPAPVSRRFHSEMMAAMLSSRSGTLVHEFGVSSSDMIRTQLESLLLTNKIFDKAIISTCMHMSYLTYNNLVTYKQRFCNLKTIESRLNAYSHPSHMVTHKIRQIDLLGFMEGEHNAPVQDIFHRSVKHIIFNFGPIDLTVLDGVKIIWYLRTLSIFCPCPDPHCFLEGAVLDLDIVTSRDQSTITTRRISPLPAHNLSSKDALAHVRLQRLIQRIQTSHKHTLKSH